MKTIDDVLREMEPAMGMISKDELMLKMESSESLTIIDLRSKALWNESHLKNSKQVLLQELPDLFHHLLPNKNEYVVCICNGSVQSAMAMVFLRSKGYQFCYNLSGGFSGWIRANLPVD